MHQRAHNIANPEEAITKKEQGMVNSELFISGFHSLFRVPYFLFETLYFKSPPSCSFFLLSRYFFTP